MSEYEFCYLTQQAWNEDVNARELSRLSREGWEIVSAGLGKSGDSRDADVWRLILRRDVEVRKRLGRQAIMAMDLSTTPADR